MHSINFKNESVQFIIMVIIGVLFNPMNILAYKFNHLYFSLTLLYGGILMASNMIWAHTIIHYINHNHFNSNLFIIGIILSIITSYKLLRGQLFVTDKQWLKRMIPHHSTALTTSYNINKISKDPKIIKLSQNIIDNQEKEIKQMKKLLNNK